MSCPAGYEKSGLMCLSPCNPGEKQLGNMMCQPSCPSGGTDMGFLCRGKNGVIIPKPGIYPRRMVPLMVDTNKEKEMAMQKDREMAMQKEKEMAMQKEMAIKAMAPGQVGGMIGGPSKEMGAKVGTTDQGVAKNIPSNNNTMFGNIAVKEGGAPGAPYAKMAEKAPSNAPPSQYGAAKIAEKAPTGPAPMMKEEAVKGMVPGQMGGMIGGAAKIVGGDVKMIGQGIAPPGQYGAAQPPTKPPPPPGAYGVAKSTADPPPGAYGVAKEVPKISGDVMMEQIKKGELPTGIPKPMIKEEAVKAMAPGQSGGMIGGAGKEMGGKVEMIGQGLAPKMELKVATAKEIPMVTAMGQPVPSKEVKNMPEAIAKKVDPEVKKIVDSFGKPESSQVEQKKMEAMKAMGVEPPKDAKDMEDLRKGIYRPDGKEIPGTALFESFKKDLAAFASMLMKLVGGKQSGYTSGEMFGSTNSLILIALVVAIVFASRR